MPTVNAAPDLMRTAAIRLDQLTSLRFFAALAVLLSHLWPLAEEANPLQPVARTVFSEGHAGVSFFFVLSGYILAHTYQHKLASGAISSHKYLALRLARIVPLHWLVSLPLAVLALAQGGAGVLPNVALNFALLQSWIPGSEWYFTVNEPSWSLSDEAFFYVCFVALALLPVRRLVLLAGMLLLLNLSVVLWRIGSGQQAIRIGEHYTLTHWLVYINPVARLLDFVVGMLVYRLQRMRGGTALELASVLLLLGAMTACSLLQVADAWRMQLAYLPLMALVVWVFGSGSGALTRVLARSDSLVLLGDASFALYLVHLPVVHAGLAVQEWLDTSALPWLAWAALVILVAVALSVMVFRYIETPLLRSLRSAINARFVR